MRVTIKRVFSIWIRGKTRELYCYSSEIRNLLRVTSRLISKLYKEYTHKVTTLYHYTNFEADAQYYLGDMWIVKVTYSHPHRDQYMYLREWGYNISLSGMYVGPQKKIEKQWKKKRKKWETICILQIGKTDKFSKKNP